MRPLGPASKAFPQILVGLTPDSTCYSEGPHRKMHVTEFGFSCSCQNYHSSKNNSSLHTPTHSLQLYYFFKTKSSCEWSSTIEFPTASMTWNCLLKFRYSSHSHHAMSQKEIAWSVSPQALSLPAGCRLWGCRLFQPNVFPHQEQAVVALQHWQQLFSPSSTHWEGPWRVTMPLAEKGKRSS